jgi:flagellar basal body-associated protein FliL
MTTLTKPAIKSRRKRKIIFSLFCLLMLFAGVGVVLALFVFNENVCKNNEYLDNHRCYPCYDGCKNCEGNLTNQCTKCWGSLWLVKLNNQ